MSLAIQRLWRLAAVAVAAAGGLLFCSPVLADTFTDSFSGTTLNPAWEVNIPLGGPTITQNNGLKIYTPAVTYDAWVGVQNAPSVTLLAPAGDFTVSAKLQSADDPTGTPLDGVNYHSAVIVSFGGSDLLYWGAYRSNTHLQLERSGQGNLAGADIAGLPVWLQIKKQGNVFHFSYKQQDSDPWTEVTTGSGQPYTITVSARPQKVGLMQKTWAAVEGTATWSTFSLEADKLSFPGTVSGKVTTNGPSPTRVDVQALSDYDGQATLAPVAADGSYQLSLSPGSYTISLVGDDLLNPGPTTSKSNVAVQAGQTVSLGFSAQLRPELNPATDQIFQDDFAGTSARAQWLTLTPLAGATVSVSNGLTFTLSNANAYDFWATVANAPQVVLPAPDGDFVASVQLKSAVDSTGTPMNDQNYHSVLVVGLGGNDALMWGIYRSDQLVRVERSGVGTLGEAPIPGLPVWLQVQKTGNHYTFAYKQNASDPWTTLAAADGKPIVVTVPAKPQTIGMMQKTWANIGMTSTFASFRLEATEIRYFGVLAGKVTTNGPSPTRVTVEARSPDGTLAGTSAVASDGSFSMTVGAGNYTVAVAGYASQPGASQSTTVQAGQTTNVNLSVALPPDFNSATNQVLDDKFDGTALKPHWNASIPVAGPTISVNNGLKITVPDSQAYDWWVGVGNSPNVSLPAPEGDFEVSAKLDSVVDPSGSSIEGQNCHAVLFVGFGGTNAYLWGRYQTSGHLVLEYSGINGIGTADLGSDPVWVRVKRTGNQYTFSYRQKDTDAWTDLADADGNPIVRTEQTAPTTVGLMLKTWANVAATATWHEFRLEAPTLRYYGILAGKVTSPGANIRLFSVQLLDANGDRIATVPVAADGSYSVQVLADTYTVRLFDGTPIVQASKPNVAVAPNVITTLDFDLSKPAVVKGDLNGDGNVSIVDVTLALQIAVGLRTGTAAQIAAGDLNGDGTISIAEVSLILQAAVGLRTL